MHFLAGFFLSSFDCHLTDRGRHLDLRGAHCGLGHHCSAPTFWKVLPSAVLAPSLPWRVSLLGGVGGGFTGFLGRGSFLFGLGFGSLGIGLDGADAPGSGTRWPPPDPCPGSSVRIPHHGITFMSRSPGWELPCILPAIRVIPTWIPVVIPSRGLPIPGLPSVARPP